MSLLLSKSYYLSDNAYSGIYYAYQSPEYLSRFCANGHFLNENCYERFAYFRRDKDSCLKNLKNFCKNNDFSDLETEKVLNCFEILWKQNVHKDEHFYLFLIPRKLVDRTEENITQYLRNNIKNMTKRQIINFMLRSRYIHDKTFTEVFTLLENILFLIILK